MKNLPLIELLEDRIAPATLINPTTVTYTDIDGDAVVLKISKPLFTSATVANDVLTFSTGSVNNSNTTGQQLQEINLTLLPAAAHMNLSVTVLPQLGVGNGKADVGYIKAAVIDSDVFQFFNNIDLGTVTIQGDLGKIDVGDNFVTPAIKALNVGSMGTDLTSGAPDLQSNILGPLSSFHATGNVENVRIHVIGGKFGNIGTLTIDGSLMGGLTSNLQLGGVVDNTGQISFTGKLGNATIGNIVGGDGMLSGAVVGSLETSLHSTISNVKVPGSITGGTGTNSGAIIATNVKTATVGADVTGGGGQGSGLIVAQGALGNVTVGGSLVGGAMSDTGEISGNTSVGSVTIGRSIQGGSGAQSGHITSNGSLGKLVVSGGIVGGSGSGSGLTQALTIGSVAVAGSLTGGTGPNSGEIFASNSIGPLTIGGSIVGGSFQDSTFTGDTSGAIVTGAAGAISIGKNVQGGTGNNSGEILVGGTLKSLNIGGDLIGGNSSASAKLTNSGYIQAGFLPSVLIGSSVTAGTDGGGGIASSGAIRSTTQIGTLTVSGNISGNDGNNAIISAAGIATSSTTTNIAIDHLTVLGNVDRTEILAGYGTDTSTSSRGNALNPDAQINTVTIGGNLTASSIVAGVSAGADGQFGTADDVKISATFPYLDLPGIVSRISSILVTGSNGASGTAANDAESFGIVAQEVVLVNIKGIPLALTSGAANDLAPGVVIGTTPGTGTSDGFDFHALEVPL